VFVLEDARAVVEVVFLCLRALDFLKREHFEEFLGRDQGRVRAADADADQEG